jgi:hypothetical protein
MQARGRPYDAFIATGPIVVERSEVLMRPNRVQSDLASRPPRAVTAAVIAVLVLAGCGSVRSTGGAAASSVPASATISAGSASAATSAGAASAGASSVFASAGTSAAVLVSARTFGTGPAQELLTIAPAGDNAKAVVPESVARHDVDHPLAGAPNLLHPVLFTLARATASMLGWEGTGAAPVFRSTLAWVGVFEVDPNAWHGCPAEPAPTPESFPPLQAHYYFAVLVDATTGAQATWNEDESGLLMRQCAGLRSSPTNHG